MAGTIEGGKKAAEQNKKRHGNDFYKKIGKKGADNYNKLNEQGKAKPRGFAYAKLHLDKSDPAHPSNAGSVGGKKSRR